MSRGIFSLGFWNVVFIESTFMSKVSLIALLAGAVCSVGLMLHAGRHNPSRILMVLFTLWVLSPFVALGFAHLVSERWSPLTRAALYALMLVVALGSLVPYADVALGPRRAKTATVFVVVPPVSWLLIPFFPGSAALISRRRLLLLRAASCGR